jgi:4-azaleucine resistance transporter AzlC
VRAFLRAVRAAFPHTLPVLTGYLCLGTAFGVLLADKGWGLPWALLMSVTVYAGSMQFVGVSLLAGAFHPLQAALLTLMVNARHLFYALSMLPRWTDAGRAKPYLVFANTDETFSLLISAVPPPGIAPRTFELAVSLLDQLYWVTGSLLGAALGRLLPVLPEGLDFVMTALFVVIFLEQWRGGKGRVPALMGLGAAFLCRLLFGTEWFLLPTMALLTALLTLGRGRLEGGGTV